MDFRTIKRAAAAILTLFVLLFIFCGYHGLVGYNYDQNWQVHQSLFGQVTIIDTPGPYFKGLGSVWTYPRTMKAYYSAHRDEQEDGRDRSVPVTFNDNGTAMVSSYVMIRLPLTREKRRLLHQEFQASVENVKDAIRSHLINCLKASGPVMSASENQASRKAEFNQIVEDQLAKGLFKMIRTEIELSDLSTIEETKDEQGNKTAHEKKARVQATQIVLDDDGKPIIMQPSPLLTYDIEVRQFSMTAIDYDEQTLKQFSAKKESHLNAERSKAQRQEEVQQRLMVEERGRRQVADVAAEENQKKTRAMIQAQQEADVAVVTKTRAVTAAAQRTEVAEQQRLEADKMRQIAQIKAATAELDKQATISAAQAQQKSIELGGGISEEKRVLATIAADRDVKVAQALAQVAVPGTVMIGGDKGGSYQDALMNLTLMRATGLLREPNRPSKETP